MSFFPESICPANIKSEAENVDGNRYILSGSDHNRIDEEIRAIEKIVGIRGSNDPCSMFFMLRSVCEQLQSIRDKCVQTASGVVAVSGFSGASGQILFPSDWGTTTLSSGISDNSINDDNSTNDPSLNPTTIQLADVDAMPDEGYITIINDTTTTSAPAVHPSGTYVENIAEYVFSGFSGFSGHRNVRAMALGTNVEIMSYYGISGTSLLNVQRKQRGTTSTSHSVGDIVFKGVLSIGVTPACFEASGSFAHVDCLLRSNGQIEMHANAISGFSGFSDDTAAACAAYQAVLVNPILPIQGCP